MHRTAIIMAGGAGERFWPLSRKRKPKQLLKLTNPDKSMLQEAIDRISPVIAPDNIFVVTSELLQGVIRDEIQGLPSENVIAEPSKRNTAGCIALAAAFIAERMRDAGATTADISMAVLTADHHISDEERFRQTVQAALAHAEQGRDLVTLGIRPKRAATEYGYVEYRSDNGSSKPLQALPVLRFCEKPDLATAERFLAAGNFLWNSGMFFWRLDTLQRALTEQLPEIGSKINDLRQGLQGCTRQVHPGPPVGIDKVFSAFPDISIDYGLMEKASEVAVIPASFGWDDVGSLDSLARTHPPDKQGNVASGAAVLLDSNSNIVVNTSPDGEKVVAVIGMDDVAIINTENALLVCPRSRLQEVKQAVKTVREHFGEGFV